MAHPSFEELVNLAGDALPAGERARVDAHLNQPCSHCQARLRKITELLQLMDNDQTVAPPPPVVQRMLAVIKRLTPGHPRLPVRLIFDSWQHAPLAATRSATQAQQLLFAAEGLDIDLHFTPGPDNTTMRGQILGGQRPEDRPAPLVVLQSGEEIVALTRTDRLGQFVFQSIPAGSYDLHIELEQNQIAIEGIQLGK